STRHSSTRCRGRASTASLSVSTATSVGKDDLVVRGVNGGEYHPVSFSYQSGIGELGVAVATWTLDRPLGADRVFISLDDARVSGADDGGQTLDGEYTDNAINTYFTGDG